MQIGEDWKAVVADFGLTKFRKQSVLRSFVGSPAWAAPEGACAWCCCRCGAPVTFIPQCCAATNTMSVLMCMGALLLVVSHPACIVNPLWPCAACAADIKPSPRYGIVLWEIYMQALPYSGMDAHAVIAQGAGEQQVLAGNEALTAFQWRINTDDPHCRPQHVGSTST